jgi:hypothetical protein
MAETEIGGAYYQLMHLDNKPLQKTIWLCNVLLFVFGHLPLDIYFRRIS